MAELHNCPRPPPLGLAGDLIFRMKSIYLGFAKGEWGEGKEGGQKRSDTVENATK